MSPLTVQDGKLLLRDGKLGTEQACCCKKCEGPCDDENPCPEGCECVDGECCPECIPCPDDFTSLCFSVTLTDYEGNTTTLTQDDITPGFLFFFWNSPNGTSLSVSIFCLVDCGGGVVVAASGSVSGFPGCFCTAAAGGATLKCTNEEGWHLGTITGNIVLEDTAGCGDDCPDFDIAGSFSVTISEPPC